MKRNIPFAGLAMIAALCWSTLGSAAEVTLKVMHFLPAGAPAQTKLIEPWAKAVQEQSGGRIEVKIYPAMQLGGKAPQLIDQVRDGIVDVVWTLPGYTPGRFPKLSVYELPFMISDAAATSKAVQEFYETEARDEFVEVHPLFFHVHAGGLLHTNKPVRTMDDLKGLKIRVPTRPTGDMFSLFGSAPVFMPVPELPEALSKNVIDGASVPWEVTVPLRLYELVKYHTTFTGPRRMQTSTFAYVMNKNTYESLPDDLKKVIDDNSGMAWAAKMGQVWEEIEEPGRKLARERNNTFLVMSEEDTAKLAEMAQPVVAAWVKEMTEAGADGEALLAKARALLEKHSTQ